MEISKQVANQFKEVHIDGTWITNTNFKTILADVNWEIAAKRIGSLNSIAMLTYHINYYLAGVLKVLEGGPLDIRDKYSFDLPPITSQSDWEELQNKFLKNANKITQHIEAMNDQELLAGFAGGKYGTNYRNLTGMIEHAYYHLGQIVMIKKLITEQIL